MKSFSTADALKFGINSFLANYKFLVSVSFIAYCIGNLSLFLFPVEEDRFDISFIGVSVIGFIISLILSIGLLRISLKLVDGQQVGWSDLTAKVSLFWRYLFVSLIYAVIIGFGIILFIIPGIYVALTYYFGHYLVVDKGLGPIAALKKSGAIMRGHKWKFLVFGVIMVLINMVALLPLSFIEETAPVWQQIVFSIGLFITMPITYLATAYVYRKLENIAQIVQN